MNDLSGLINKSYHKPRWKFTFSYWGVVLLILLLIVLTCNKVKGQATISLTETHMACGNFVVAYVTGYYPADVHAVSLTLEWDSLKLTPLAVGRNDVFIDGMCYDSLYRGHWKFSWWSLNPLQYSDTLFALYFTKQGEANLEWQTLFGNCELADFNAVNIPCHFEDGYLYCSIGVGIKELQKETELKLMNYDLLGRRIK